MSGFNSGGAAAGAGAGGAIGSVIPGVGTLIGAGVGALAGGFLLPKPPEAPKLSSPNALSAQPTQAQASATASRATLDQERMAASTSTVLTGGQGLLDQPTTTSRTLLGS